MAITQATSLADFSTGIGTAGAVLQVDNTDGRVGIGTTDPQADLQVGIAITMDGTAGVITASSFSGSGGNLTFTGADISAATASFTGNVSVGGTLTYEDVTNIDAVGVITARTGVKVTAGGVDVTAGGLNVTAGVSTFAADLSIADKIIHTGDTNTAIRFPAADTFTVETGGSEAIRVDSSQRLLVGTTSSILIDGVVNSKAQIEHTNYDASLTIKRNQNSSGGPTSFFVKSRGTSDGSNTVVQSGDTLGRLRFFGTDGSDPAEGASISAVVDGTPGSNDMPGRLTFNTTADGASSPTERLRITSAGLVGINSESPASILDVTTEASSNSGINFTNIGAAPIIDFKGNNVASAGRIRMNEASGGGVLQFATKTTGGTVTEAFRIDNSQRLLIGHTSDVMGCNVQSSTTGGNNFAAGRFAANTGGPDIVLRKSRNATVGSHTIVQDNDDLGNIFWGGSNGSAFKNGARITASVDGTPGSGDDMPARLTFFTSAESSSSPTERLRIDSSGNVGINSTNPGYLLDIASSNASMRLNSTSTSTLVITSGASNSARIEFGDLANNDTGYIYYDNSSDSMQFATNGSTERFRIASDGNLRHSGSGGETIFEMQRTDTNTSGAVGTINFLASDDHSVASMGAMGDGDNEGAHIVFRTTSAAANESPYNAATPERLRIQADGHVKIFEHLAIGQDPSSTYPLMITENTRYQIAINNSGADQSYPWFVHDDVSSASALLIHFNGIADRFTFKENGDFIAVGNVTAYSDVSLKENIETVPNALDKVLNLRGVYFDKKDQPDVPRQMGVIAQEVEEVVPEVVSTGSDEMKTVAYGNLVGLLIESIKELKAEVNDLRAQLEG